MKYSIHFFVIVWLTVVSFAAVSQENIEPLISVDHPDSSNRYMIENSHLFLVNGTDREEIILPALVHSFYLTKDKLYVALGTQGAAVFTQKENASPILDRMIPATRGPIVGFFEVNNQVWMRIETTTGVPIDELVLSMPESGSSKDVIATTPIYDRKERNKPANFQNKESSSPKITTPIRIQKIFKGEVTLNLGEEDGVRVGDKFVVSRKYVIKQRGDQTFTGKQQVGVIEVFAVDKKTSLASISRGDRMLVTDEVQPYKTENTQHTVFPRRLDHLGEVSVIVRPILNVDGKTKGFGGLCDLVASWWGKYYFANLRIQPIGIGWTDEQDIVTSNILAEGGYDGRSFAVGIGAGAGIVNGNMDAMISKDRYWDKDNKRYIYPNSGTQMAFALSQIVRLGARDGLNLVVYNSFLYYNDKNAPNAEEDDSSFIYGGTTGRINIPLTESIDLYLSGGGGRMGYAFGEAGIFAWLVGKGDSGSWGLSAAAGGAGIWMKKENSDDEQPQKTAIAGPLVSIGATYRFGG